MNQKRRSDEKENGLGCSTQQPQLDGNACSPRQVSLWRHVGLGDHTGGHAQQGRVEQLDDNVEYRDCQATCRKRYRVDPSYPGTVDERGDGVSCKGKESWKGNSRNAVVYAQSTSILAKVRKEDRKKKGKNKKKVRKCFIFPSSPHSLRSNDCQCSSSFEFLQHQTSSGWLTSIKPGLDLLFCWFFFLVTMTPSWLFTLFLALRTTLCLLLPVPLSSLDHNSLLLSLSSSEYLLLSKDVPDDVGCASPRDDAHAPVVYEELEEEEQHALPEDLEWGKTPPVTDALKTPLMFSLYLSLSLFSLSLSSLSLSISNFYVI